MSKETEREDAHRFTQQIPRGHLLTPSYSSKEGSINENKREEDRKDSMAVSVTASSEAPQRISPMSTQRFKDETNCFLLKELNAANNKAVKRASRKIRDSVQIGRMSLMMSVEGSALYRVLEKQRTQP